MSWEPLFHLLGDYYPELVCDFYATLLHKIYKNFQIIISTAKRVRSVLDRVCLVTILGIRDEGHMVNVDSNRKTIQVDPDWSYEATSNRFQIRPHLGQRRAILHGGGFPNLLPPSLSKFLWTHFSAK